MKKLLLLCSLPTLVAASYVITVPDGATPTLTVAPTGTPPPPQQCVPPQTGIWPNCITPPPPSTFCAPYTVLSSTATWGTGGVWYTKDIGPFTGTTAWVFTLYVPAGAQPTLALGSFTVAEYQSQGTPRQLTISTQACDFRPVDYTGANGPLSACYNGTSCRVLYAVQAPNLFSGVAGLSVGTTYYVSARNWSSGGNSCPVGSCSAVMNMTAATP